MRILNFGSMNYDYVYNVDHIVQPGETLDSSQMEIFCGGKGLNQSLALSRAGVKVYHAGIIGEDGEMLLDLCRENGINTDFLQQKSVKNGHAIIQVNKQGQNCIILFAGSNGQNTEKHIDEILSHFDKDDIILLQNEVNLLDKIIDKAYKKGMIIILNPSPYNSKINQCDLNKVSMFLINEVEGYQISGVQEPEAILKTIHEKYPNVEIVLTLGAKGAMYSGKGKTFYKENYDVKVVDTTAAGDTFTGYYLASILDGKTIKTALQRASAAASISVSRKGASVSIPFKEEVDEFLKNK